jgi:hypothetical protein
MTAGSSQLSDSGADRNSKSKIEKRVTQGQVTWTGPITLVAARTFLLVVVQGLVAVVYALRHHPSPWQAAAPWWSIYGTLVDIGCLLLMTQFTRAEGIRIRDLIGKVRLRRGRDIFAGIGYYLLIFPCFLGGSILSSLLVYGSIGPHLAPGQLYGRALPFWAVVYTLSLWWIIWAPTEETTYQAYVLPRLEALFERPWIPVMVVAFWWTLQHSALPLIFDWRYIVWRFGSFAPGVFVTIMIYRKTRRLPPLIVAHWPMDIAAAAFTVKF